MLHKRNEKIALKVLKMFILILVRWYCKVIKKVVLERKKKERKDDCWKYIRPYVDLTIECKLHQVFALLDRVDILNWTAYDIDYSACALLYIKQFRM